MIVRSNLIFLFISFLVFLAVFTAYSQPKAKPVATGVYMTYTDYAQRKLKPMDDFHSYSDTLGKSVLTFIKGGKKIKFDCSEIWGFQYRYKLFRCGTNSIPPLRVISVGKIAYYENGLAHLEMIKYDKETGDYKKGYCCYISANLLGDIFPFPPDMKSEAYKETEKFRKKNKQYEKLFKCIETNYNTSKISDCIKTFEREK